MYYMGYDKFLRKHHGNLYSHATRIMFAWHYTVKLCIRPVSWVVSSGEAKRRKMFSVFNAWYAVWYSLFPNVWMGSER